MNDQRTATIIEPSTAEIEPTLRDEPETNDGGLEQGAGSPVPKLLMFNSGDAGHCTGDACAIPMKEG